VPPRFGVSAAPARAPVTRRYRRPPSGSGSGQESAAEGPARPPASPAQLIEAHILGVLLRRPDLLFRLDRALQESGLGRMAVEDFGYTDHQLLFRLVRQSLEQDAEEADLYLRVNLPASLSELADELLKRSGELDPLEDRLIEDLFRGIIKIRRTVLGESIDQLRFLQEEAQQTGDLRAASYRERVQQQSLLLRRLDQAGLKPAAQR
jgi:hypothetical protein